MAIGNVNIYMKKNKLIALLKDAFDEGWFGYLELKDEVCERIASSVISESEEDVMDYGYEESPIRRRRK
jgi:hypothetical protein|tara:strand:- start:63 stop:269 length:207 start_codon:yes stop_codon:yes gene_type:complete